jgi:hypothetical protein
MDLSGGGYIIGRILYFTANILQHSKGVAVGIADHFRGQSNYLTFLAFL